VLAAVSAGVYMSRQLPRVLSARSRLRDFNVWGTLVFLLNGLIFVLIGLQLPAIAAELSHIRVGPLMLWSAAISIVTIVLRIAWVYAMAWLPRAIFPSIRKNDPMPEGRVLFVIGWAGMRGIVTLAAAMALPNDFPFRSYVIFVSFAVIVATLVLQGLSLPPIIKLLGLGDDGSALREEREARWEATHAALARLQAMTFSEQLPAEVLHRVRESYDERLNALSRHHAIVHGGEPVDHNCPIETLRRVHMETLEAERRMVTFLRDQNVIGDEVLRRIVGEIDLEEAKLA
jgi:monovalent cation/hydrogen antiporter